MSHVRDLLARDRADLSDNDRARIDEHLAGCADCRRLAAELVRADRLLARPEPWMVARGFARLPARGEPRLPLALATAAVVAIAAVLALAPTLSQREERAARPTPSPAVTASPGTPPSGTSRAVYDDLVLGYRLTLPDGYRVLRTTIGHGTGDELGGTAFTAVTEAEARRACEDDIGHIPAWRPRPDLQLSVFRNPEGLTPAEWATTPRPHGFVWATHQRVEPVATPADAVRLVSVGTGQTWAYVIGANDRIYVLYISSPTPAEAGTLIEEVARTFVPIRPIAFPTPTPARDGEAALAAAASELARAFAARDADAVARLTHCWISYHHTIDGEVVGMGGQGRSVPRFTEGLRERFGRGDLTVVVDPTVRTGRNGHYVRSEWREPDRVRLMDLYLTERDGRWQWTLATHHYRSTDFAPPGCMSYRMPWNMIRGC